MFEVSDFTNVIKFVFNRSDLDFAEMYKSFGITNDAYAYEHFLKARNYFAVWWCELDDETKFKVILYVKDFYKK